MHVLFHCNLYDDLRKILFMQINERNKLFTNYNNRVKYVFFLTILIHTSAGLLLLSFFKHLKDERNIIIFNYTTQLYL